MAGLAAQLLMLAQSDESPVQLIVYGAILLLSLLGGILGKKKKEKDLPQTPTSKGPSRPPTPKPRPGSERVERPPSRPQVKVPPTVARPARPRPVPVSAPRPVELEPVVVELDEDVAPTPQAKPTVTVPIPTLAEAAMVRPERHAPSPAGRELRKMLRSRQSLRTAIVLREVLGPPVGMQ